ncbi:ubiquitinyl hydrolase 1 [Ranunculus cassubicifolius]
MEDDEAYYQSLKSHSHESINPNIIGDAQPAQGPPTEFYFEDPIPVKYVFKIKNFQRLSAYISPVFFAGGYNWQVVTKFNDEGYMSVFLKVAQAHELQEGWAVWTSVKFTLNGGPNQYKANGCFTLRKFHDHAQIWGYPKFASGAEFDKCYQEDNMTIGVLVLVHADSHGLIKRRRFLGFKNNLSTCPLPSLLQCLFYVPYFKETILKAKSTSDPPLLALKNVFNDLKWNDEAVETRNIINSFGWNDSFLHNGLQILFIDFCKKLGPSMKGVIDELFLGYQVTSITTDGQYSEITEPFHGLKLAIEGFTDIYHSLDQYVDMKDLYSTSNSLQVGRRQITKFPPVLLLHLNRIEYSKGLNKEKNNARFGFPQKIDFGRDEGKYLSVEQKANSKECWEYKLHSVVTHTGTTARGTYSAYIKVDNIWLKFEDERVTKDATSGIELFGWHDESPDSSSQPNLQNAIMLVYVKKSEKYKLTEKLMDSEHIKLVTDVQEEEILRSIVKKIKFV